MPANPDQFLQYAPAFTPSGIRTLNRAGFGCSSCHSQRDSAITAKAMHRKEKKVLRAQWLEQLGLPATNGTVLFGSLSRITEQKGIDLTIHALAKVLLHAGDLKLAYIVGGGGPDRKSSGNGAIPENREPSGFHRPHHLSGKHGVF